MFRFENPEYLYFLSILPFLFLLYILSFYYQRKEIRRFGDLKLLKSLMPEASTTRKHVKFVLLSLSLICLIIAFARPQMGIGMETNTHKGSEVIIALDVSNSMMAQDASPCRLDAAKQLITGLVDKMENDRVGLIAFAGEAFTQMPITDDYVSAKMFLDGISPLMITTQGTDIGKAIKLAEKSFTQKKNIGKSIIIITDGENHEGGAEEAAKEAVKNGLHLLIVGVGSPNGAPVPDMAHRGNYLKNAQGDVVITHLNEAMCKQIARQGKGRYLYMDNPNLTLIQIMNDLNRMEKAETSVVTYNSYEEQYQWFILSSLFFLIMDACLLERKNQFFNRLNIFRKIRKR